MNARLRLARDMRAIQRLIAHHAQLIERARFVHLLARLLIVQLARVVAHHGPAHRSLPARRRELRRLGELIRCQRRVAAGNRAMLINPQLNQLRGRVETDIAVEHRHERIEHAAELFG